MKITAKYISDSCIEAANGCPQYDEPDEDQDEIVKGKYVCVAKLHKRGVEAVIKYWRDSDTIGGSILWSRGYSAELPEDVLDLFSRIDSLISKAIREAL